MPTTEQFTGPQETTWTVPSDVTQVRVRCWGASSNSVAGGYVSGVVDVQPGEVYRLILGEDPATSSTGGTPDGGDAGGSAGNGGGGRTEFKSDSTTSDSTLLVAAGAGGTGGATGGDDNTTASGGEGGSDTGQGGGTCVTPNTKYAVGGGGGSQTSGGSGGGNGSAGAFKSGGVGGADSSKSAVGHGGGGGGGWYGGGGGEGITTKDKGSVYTAGAGGGGGSNRVNSSVSDSRSTRGYGVSYPLSTTDRHGVIELVYSTTEVFGTIADTTGAALSGATVYAINATTSSLEGVTTTDSNGEYAVTVPDQDEIVVAAQYKASDGTVYNGRAEPSATAGSQVSIELDSSYQPPASDSVSFRMGSTSIEVDSTSFSSDASVTSGATVSVDVTVTNTGDSSDSAQVNLLANRTEVASTSVSLSSGENTTVSLSWDTTGSSGQFTIEAETPVSRVTAEEIVVGDESYAFSSESSTTIDTSSASSVAIAAYGGKGAPGGSNLSYISTQKAGTAVGTIDTSNRDTLELYPAESASSEVGGWGYVNGETTSGSAGGGGGLTAVLSPDGTVLLKAGGSGGAGGSSNPGGDGGDQEVGGAGGSTEQTGAPGSGSVAAEVSDAYTQEGNSQSTDDGEVYVAYL